MIFYLFSFSVVLALVLAYSYVYSWKRYSFLCAHIHKNYEYMWENISKEISNNPDYFSRHGKGGKEKISTIDARIKSLIYKNIRQLDVTDKVVAYFPDYCHFKKYQYFQQKIYSLLVNVMENLKKDSWAFIRQSQQFCARAHDYYSPEMGAVAYEKYCLSLLETHQWYEESLPRTVPKKMAISLAFKEQKVLVLFRFKPAEQTINKQDLQKLVEQPWCDEMGTLFYVTNVLPTRAAHLFARRQQIYIIHHGQLVQKLADYLGVPNGHRNG